MEAIVILAIAATQTQIDTDAGYHLIPKHNSDEFHKVAVHQPSNPYPCEIAVAVKNRDGSTAYYTCKY